jgi:hypothetical protein
MHLDFSNLPIAKSVYLEAQSVPSVLPFVLLRKSTDVDIDSSYRLQGVHQPTGRPKILIVATAGVVQPSCFPCGPNLLLCQ